MSLEADHKYQDTHVDLLMLAGTLTLERAPGE